jgi:hypothetical protein
MATDDLVRLHALDFQATKTILSGQVNAELDQLISTSNTKASRVINDTIQSAWQFQKGVNVASSSPTSTAGSFWYDASSNNFKGIVGSTTYTFGEVTSFIDVNTYGTDATAFVNALNANAGKIILVPNGTYNLSPTLAQVPTLLAGIANLLPIGTINITLPVGNVALSSMIPLANFYPSNIGITGSTPIALTGVTWQATSGSAGNYSIILNVSTTTGLEVGQLARLTPVTGTGDFGVLEGAWLITNVDTANSRITIKHTFMGGAFPTFTLTNATLSINTSTLTFTGSSGFLFYINSPLKAFYQISLVGDYNIANATGTSATYGIYSHDTANLTLGTTGQTDAKVNIQGFGEHGFYAKGSSAGTISGLTTTGNRLAGIYTEGANLKGSSVVSTGNGQYGGVATQDGVLNAQYGNYSANGIYGLKAESSGVVNAYGSTVLQNVVGTFVKDDISTVLLRTETKPSFSGIQLPRPTYATARTFTLNGNAYAKSANGVNDLFVKGNKTVSLDRVGFNGLKTGTSLAPSTTYYGYMTTHPSLCDGGYVLDTAQNVTSHNFTVQNLLAYSESLENWTLTDATVAPNDPIVRDPLGGFQYDKIAEGTAGTAQVAKTFTTATTTVTRTARIKKGSGLTWIRMAIEQSTNRVQAWLNLDTGALGTVNNTGTASSPSATVEALPDGSYLLALTGTFASSPSNTLTSSASADASTTRVNNSVYYLWGNQVFDGSVILPYQPTFATPYPSQTVAFNSQQVDILAVTDSSSNLIEAYFTAWDFKKGTWSDESFARTNINLGTTANAAGTYTRAGSVTTVAVTAHGQKTGDWVHATFTGGATNGWHQITVVDANTFTIGSSAGTGTITTNNVTLNRRATRKVKGFASFVSCDPANRGVFFVPFSILPPDANYIIDVGMGQYAWLGFPHIGQRGSTLVDPTTAGFFVSITSEGAGSNDIPAPIVHVKVHI